jgi:hypothetical protein
VLGPLLETSACMPVPCLGLTASDGLLTTTVWAADPSVLRCQRQSRIYCRHTYCVHDAHLVQGAQLLILLRSASSSAFALLLRALRRPPGVAAAGVIAATVSVMTSLWLGKGAQPHGAHDKPFKSQHDLSDVSLHA